MIELLKKDRLEESIGILDYCFEFFHETLKNENNLLRKRVLEAMEDNRFFGMVENGKLISQGMYFLYNINIGNTVLPMGGLGMISALPEARVRGNTSKVIVQMLEDMYKRNIPVSVLAPFSYRYYRTFGYEFCYRKKEITININRLEGCLRKNDYFKRADKSDIKGLNEIYEITMRDKNGYISRGDIIWEQSHLNDYLVADKKRHCYVSIDESGTYQGYVFYTIDKLQFIVHEFGYRNISALRSIFGFIHSHKSQCNEVVIVAPDDFKLEILLGSPKFQLRGINGMCARIINVKLAMEMRSFSEFEQVKIKICDDLIPENSGNYCLSYDKGKCKVTSCAEYDVEIPLTDFATLYFGFNSAETLHKYERINCSQATVEKLNKLFQSKCTYMNDNF